MQLDARPFFEYYPTDASFDPKTGVFTCDIAIPVAAI
jgi:AraC family transcriptional regulator